MEDLTNGNVRKKLLNFCLPFLGSTVIQAAINLVDLLVVSLFSEKQGGIAGVGIGNQISYLIINAIVGLCVGGSILISQYFGGEKYKEMTKTINSLFSILIIISIIITIIMVFSTNILLRLLKTPEEAMSEAKDYVIYTMLGLIFVYMYNGASCILRGLGDSKRPLIFISIAAIINIGLDFLAIIVLQMGAKGVALATIVSQAFGAFASIIYLYKKRKSFQIGKIHFLLDREKIKEILRIGIPTATQNIIASLSFLALTYIINVIGGENSYYALTASSIAFRINSFAVLPARAMGNAIASMVGQNLGAKEFDRIKSTYKNGFVFVLFVGIIFSFFVFIFAENLYNLFNVENQTLMFGVPYLKSFAIDYSILPFAVCQFGLVDGLGKTKISMITNTLSSIALRLPFAYIMGKFFEFGMIGIGLAIPFSSLISGIVMAFFIKRKVWNKLENFAK